MYRKPPTILLRLNQFRKCFVDWVNPFPPPLLSNPQIGFVYDIEPANPPVGPRKDKNKNPVLAANTANLVKTQFSCI